MRTGRLSDYFCRMTRVLPLQCAKISPRGSRLRSAKVWDFPQCESGVGRHPVPLVKVKMPGVFLKSPA